MLGVDVGGSGIKGALVDLKTGALTTKRFRHATPQPATPDAVAATVAGVLTETGWQGARFGCAVPAVVIGGIAHTAANIDPQWVGADAAAVIGAATGQEAIVLNDADAAGLAEMRFGAGRGNDGVVLLLTFGTGIGSALFVSGRLVPNTEFGHLEVGGREAEKSAAGRLQEEGDLSFAEWAERVNPVLAALEKVIWPDLIVLGGGISKQQEHFMPLLTARSPLVPAELRNNAGIIGAALAAEGEV